MNIFKIALPGSDVKRSRPSEDAVNSLYPNPKVNTLASPPHAGLISLNWQSSIAVPYNTAKLIYSFAHGYNYTPTVLANCTYDNGSRTIRSMLPFQIGAIGLLVIDSDRNNINLKYYSSDLTSVTVVPPFLMKIRYYVFAEPGTP